MVGKAPRILLLQARYPDDPARIEEMQSFADRSGLPLESLRPHDLLSGPPTLAEVRSHDALMVGGSGEFYVSKRDLPRLPALFELLTEVAEVGHPTFASCFGFQCMVQALGGEIVHDPESTEVGTYDLTLTGEGQEDPLLGTLSPTFRAQMGRKDRARSLPTGMPNLATSESCPFQALRIPGTPVWATQFHPELDESTNRSRYLRYLDGYTSFMSEAEREEVLSRFVPSPETERLLKRFVELIFG